MEIQTIIKRTIGWTIILHILPVAFMCVAFYKGDPWWVGYCAGIVMNLLVIFLMGFISFVQWCFE